MTGLNFEPSVWTSTPSSPASEQGYIQEGLFEPRNSSQGAHMKNTTRHSQLRTWKTALATALCAVAFSQPGRAQVPPPSILQINVANNVLYLEDTGDATKFARNPNVVADAHSVNNFGRGVGVADIVAVNGQPVTGTHIRSAVNVGLSTAPKPGQAIA